MEFDFATFRVRDLTPEQTIQTTLEGWTAPPVHRIRRPRKLNAKWANRQAWNGPLM
jgi:hypothetical protein